MKLQYELKLRQIKRDFFENLNFPIMKNNYHVKFSSRGNTDDYNYLTIWKDGIPLLENEDVILQKPSSDEQDAIITFAKQIGYLVQYHTGVQILETSSLQGKMFLKPETKDERKIINSKPNQKELSSKGSWFIKSKKKISSNFIHGIDCLEPISFYIDAENSTSDTTKFREYYRVLENIICNRIRKEKKKIQNKKKINREQHWLKIIKQTKRDCDITEQRLKKWKKIRDACSHAGMPKGNFITSLNTKFPNWRKEISVLRSVARELVDYYILTEEV